MPTLVNQHVETQWTTIDFTQAPYPVFPSGLRVNVHMHVLWLDGVFTDELGKRRVEFCERRGGGR